MRKVPRKSRGFVILTKVRIHSARAPVAGQRAIVSRPVSSPLSGEDCKLHEPLGEWMLTFVSMTRKMLNRQPVADITGLLP
jgi:hypothetical protein